MSPERWRQIEKLYHSASERDPSQRSAFLDEACRGDQELRAELELLLAQESSPQALLERPVWEAPGYSSDAIAIGTELGGYRIEGVLGEGGMGVVYRALDTKLNRTVAVKLLSSNLADATARRRFQREAQTASSLNHPHVLTVHDAGEIGERQYLVTEFVDGGTLRDWGRIQKRDWRQVVELLVGVADGLATAHDAGILHRDVKPENILVAKNGYAKLADFGLAKLADDGSDATRTITGHKTRPGMVMGTIAYLSPEQAAGNPLDARSDIFSFGVVLYELLAGRRPFVGATGLEVLQAITHGTPQPLPPDVPAALRSLVEKALEKDPAHRYQSMREMVVDLRRLTRQSDEIHAPRTPSSSRMAWRLAVAAVVLSIAGIAAWKLWPRASLHQVRSLAVLPLRNVSRDPNQQYFADGMTDALTTGLSQVSALSVIARTSAMRYQGTQKTTPQIARELNVDAVVEGSVQRSGNRVLITAELVDGSTDHHLWAKSYERDASDALGLQYEVAQAIAGEIQVKLTRQEQARLAQPRPVDLGAQEAYLRGVYWSDKFDEPKALGYFQEAVQRDPNYAAAYAALSFTYGVMVGYGLMPAEEGDPKWRAAVTKAMELDDTLADVHVSLGILLQYHDWNWTGAEREFERAVQLNPNQPSVHLVLGDNFCITGRLDQAIAEERRARQLNPYSVNHNYMLGYTLEFAGRNDEAIQLGRMMLDLDPWYAHWVMGLAFEHKGDSQHAITELKEMVKLGKDGTQLPQGVADLAHAYAVFGRKKEALQLLAELTEMSKSRFVPSWAFAIVHVGLGDKDRAFQWLDKAYDERPSDLQNIKVDPRMEPLRSDPRYQDLLLRMGLPK